MRTVRPSARAHRAWIGSMIVAALCLSANGVAGDEKLAAGETIAPETRMGRYIASDAITYRLFQAAVMKDAELNFFCGDDYQILPGQAVTDRVPLSFPDRLNHPLYGIWLQRFDVTRCKTTSVYNAAFFAQTGEEPKMFLWYPGETAVGYDIKSDLMASLRTAARHAVDRPRCRSIRIMDTQRTGVRRDVEDRGERFASIVDERWTVNACERIIELTISLGRRHNVPDRSFVISVSEPQPRWRPDPNRQTAMPEDAEVLVDAIALLRQGSHPDAGAFILQEASGGNVIAQYAMASLSLEGVGAEGHPTSTAYWALRAAHNGFARAQHLVGSLYEIGYWFPQNYDSAAHWYKRAADNGEEMGRESLNELIAQGLIKPPTKKK